MTNAPIKSQNYKRYRDDTLDVCRNSSKEEQKQITDWMNENIRKDRIKFKIESMGDEVTFLDTQVNFMKDENSELVDNYIIVPRMFSKKTDTHQNLSPNSCHPNHITKSIPITVAHRCRTNCSDRVKDDKLFKDALIQYKAYLLKSGYLEKT